MSKKPMSTAETVAKLVEKFEGYESVTGLFGPKELASLAALRATDRVAYENLFDKWRKEKWPRLAALEKEVERTARRTKAKPTTYEDTEVEPMNLDPEDPLRIARAVLEAVLPTLIRYQDDWLIHHGSHYRTVEVDKVRGEVYDFMDYHAIEPPKARTVSDVMDALRSITLAERGVYTPPCWINEDELDYPADEILACRNGLLHIPTGTLVEHTPRFFTRVGLSYDYNANAPEPKRWKKFLQELWPDDPEVILLLQEVFGYLLMPDTSMHKFFFFRGPPRSGKGTIARVLDKLIGPENSSAPSLARIGERFGLEDLIGKQIAFISDLRLSASANGRAIVGELLRIIGEDPVSVERKHIGGAWKGKLDVRFVVFSNEIPPLPDSTRALAARLIAFDMRQDFTGREDRGLDAALTHELAGILNWSLEGWKRLKAQGQFTEPVSSVLLAEQIVDRFSPVNAFLRDCCVIHPEAKVAKTAVWQRYIQYAHANGLKPYASSTWLFADIDNATLGRVTTARARIGGQQMPCYVGLGLSDWKGTDVTEESSEGF